MGPDEKNTGPLAVYIDGQPAGTAYGEIPEISLAEEEPTEAVPPAVISGMYDHRAGRKGAGQGVGSLPGGAGVPGGHAVGLCLQPPPGLSLPAHQEKADPEEVRQADPGLVSGGGPVNATTDSE